MITNSEPKPGIKQAISGFCSIIRWDEWGDSKLPFIVLAWFISVIKSPVNAAFLLVLLETLGFTAFFLAFGYVFNDWMDRVVDQRAGKRKQIQSFKPWQVSLMLGSLFLGSIFSLLRWLTHLPVALIVMACYFFAVTYSGTSLRFKERGQWGLFIASTSQRTLPCLLVFAIMDQLHAIMLIYLVLTMVIGLRWMLAHQMGDLESDIQSQVRTYATQKNESFIKKYLVWLFNIELVLLIVLGLVISYPPLWLVYLAYLILTIAFSVVSKCTPWQMLETSSSAYIVLADFYFLYWPIGLAVLLGLRTPYGLTVLVLLAFLQLRFIRQHIAELKWLFSSLKAER